MDSNIIKREYLFINKEESEELTGNKSPENVLKLLIYDYHRHILERVEGELYHILCCLSKGVNVHSSPVSLMCCMNLFRVICLYLAILDGNPDFFGEYNGKCKR